MIDIKELRTLVRRHEQVALSIPLKPKIISELLDRLELTESRQATYREAFEISENTTRALTEKVIPNIREQLEAAEKEIESWKGLAQQFGNEADALRARIERIPSRITPEQAPEFIQDYCYEAAEGYADGWNACIKTITEK